MFRERALSSASDRFCLDLNFIITNQAAGHDQSIGGHDFSENPAMSQRNLFTVALLPEVDTGSHHIVDFASGMSGFSTNWTECVS
jgi:hypothetical protein